jgi:hypothetical protein
MPDCAGGFFDNHQGQFVNVGAPAFYGRFLAFFIAGLI